MSIKVFKNVFQTICDLIGIAIVDICLLAGYIASLFAEQPNYGWVSLIVIAATLCLFFILGFYWIFQKVTIDENGIRIMFFNKILSKCSFDEIENYKIESFMKMPTITIRTKSGKHIHLDRRNKILKCLESYNIKCE